MLRERDRLNTSLLLRPREAASEDWAAAGVTVVLESSATDWTGKSVAGQMLEVRGSGDSGTDAVLFLMSMTLGAPDFFPTIVK